MFAFVFTSSSFSPYLNLQDTHRCALHTQSSILTVSPDSGQKKTNFNTKTYKILFCGKDNTLSNSKLTRNTTMCFTCEFNVYKHSDEGLCQLRCVSIGAKDSFSLEHDWLSSTGSHRLHVGHHRF